MYSSSDSYIVSANESYLKVADEFHALLCSWDYKADWVRGKISLEPDGFLYISYSAEDKQTRTKHQTFVFKVKRMSDGKLLTECIKR